MTTINDLEVCVAVDIERALRDPEYRKTLTPEELAQLPKKRAKGELSDEDLGKVAGGAVPGPPAPRLKE